MPKHTRDVSAIHGKVVKSKRALLTLRKVRLQKQRLQNRQNWMLQIHRHLLLFRLPFLMLQTAPSETKAVF